ncbi:hypothetical protein [Pseudonocardia spinosispora]|uniref:hypothetical protein n=1 Tax=Pseudonocardia spinosispora TaxID=103441 RepID=UPI0003F96EB8|nr:hypothetical protein [Pseudonocardia spinosispora]
MSVTMQRPELMTSAELVGLLDQVRRLATSAGRSDLVERLTKARARVGRRPMGVALAGLPGQGASALVHVLEQTPADQLPGASFTDAPGGAGRNQVRLPDPAAADVVLFVSDADHEYGPAELDALAWLRSQGSAVVGVLTKIDLHPRWSEVQRANRQRLQAANLDSPSIPLLPVSSALADGGRQRHDEQLTVASGVPQLLEFLADRVGTRVEPGLRESVLGEVRAVADQLSSVWNGELESLRSSGGSAQERQQRAIAALERCQQLSASWQLALGDGATEYMAQVDFDLRDRLRDVMEEAETEITKANPIGDWQRFDAAVRRKVAENVRGNVDWATDRSRWLAGQVAARLAGNDDGAGVALPEVWVAYPDDALRRVKPMEKPDNAGMFARVINSVRGSYGGILMVGVLTSLAGQQLISIWSVTAGVLLGLFTFWEDHKNGKERSKAEAKMAVAKLMDSVNFRVGDELRAGMRAVHRTLRDHFTEINDQRLRAASDAVRAAMDTSQMDNGQITARLSELQNYLVELRQLRSQATAQRP